MRSMWRRRRPGELENTCGNPDCKGHEDHQPDPGNRIVHPREPFTPAERDAILFRSYGNH